MTLSRKSATIAKFIFIILGIFLLLIIAKNYGISLAITEIKRVGFLIFFLVLTFIPTIICYATSWMLSSEYWLMNNEKTFLRKLFIFIKITLASIAWNNMTPFVKIGGEPLKYMMLLKHLPKSAALSSVVNYNIVHIFATCLSFIITLILLIFYYQVPALLLRWMVILLIFFLVVFVLGIIAIRSRSFYQIKKYRFKLMRSFFINFHIITRKLLKFYDEKFALFCIALFVDTFARFVEGLTFYYAFVILKFPISFLNSVLIDIGRTFVDTVFFFVPYQIGAREGGVHFFMENVLNLKASGFLSAVFLYRFVEIFWIFIGYLIWAKSKSFSIESSSQSDIA
ncbi:MAG: lysylphosphatidylglycerol synthase domain-containing protein [Bacteriovorax sp.]|nr:lysylphosphatidylglycerol synthase domain-containing protein [Bacteriovorax sp.]